MLIEIENLTLDDDEMKKMCEDFFNAPSFEEGFNDFLKAQNIDYTRRDENTIKEFRRLWNLKNRSKKINKIFE